MKAVVDINLIVSALIAPGSVPGRLMRGWRQGRFSLLTCDEHLDELRSATRYPRIRSRVSPPVVGRLINEIGKLAVHVSQLPSVEASPDHFDNYLLALSEAGDADFLVSGDKAGVLVLEKYGRTKIISAREFVTMLGN